MSLISSTFVIAVHDEILLQTGVTIQEHTGLDDLMVDIVESQEDHELLAKLVAGFLYELSII